MHYSRAPIVHSQCRTAGFSLIEVTLALAVFALAIVALLSLLPTAFNTTQRGRAETYAAQIGRGVTNDLRAQTFRKARVLVSANRLSTPPTETYEELDLEKKYAVTGGELPLDVIYDAEGHAVSKASSNEYDSGVGRGVFLVRITSDPKPAVGSAARQAAVVISIEHPATAKALNRTKFTFTTIIAR